MLLQYARDLAAAQGGPPSQPNPLLSARATGEFFSAKRFIATGEGAYYGETPLMFAACTNQAELVRYLSEQWGAALGDVDSQGNTVLHMLVLHRLPAMYDFVCQLWDEQHSEHERGEGLCGLESVQNRAGLTPLTLAASMGNEVMFSHLLENRTGTQWAYGPVTCLQVPLAELDAVGWLLRQQRRLTDGTCGCEDEIDYSARPLSAVEVIVNKQQLGLLLHPRVKRLLQKKWETFGSRVFQMRLVAYCVFMFVFSVTIVLRSIIVEPEHAGWVWRDWSHHSPRGRWSHAVACSVGEAATLGVALWKGWREIAEVMNDPQGWRGHFSTRGAALLDNTLSSVFASSVLAAAVSSFLPGALPSSNACTAVASVTAWAYFMWFLLGFKLVRIPLVSTRAQQPGACTCAPPVLLTAPRFNCPLVFHVYASLCRLARLSSCCRKWWLLTC